MTRRGRAYIGTSGWSYPHWAGAFYPEGLPDRERLAYYCRYFRTVEINNSFYHLPGEHALRRWRETAPPGFVFAVKASRYLTHMKKLKGPETALGSFMDRMALLGDRLGPILYQLPPRWHYDQDRLVAFLDALDPGYRYVCEFRDPSWINPDCLQLLRAHDVAFCIYELAGVRTPLHVSADFVYVRLHGPDGAYQGSYDAAALDDWAGRIAAWQGQGLDVHVYFDNDAHGHAVANARALLARLR